MHLMYDRIAEWTLPSVAPAIVTARLSRNSFKNTRRGRGPPGCVVSRQVAMEEDECDGVSQRFALRNSSERRWQEARRDTKERRKYVLL